MASSVHIGGAHQAATGWWSSWWGGSTGPAKPANPVFGVPLDVSLANSAKHKKKPFIDRLVLHINRPGVFTKIMMQALEFLLMLAFIRVPRS